MDLKALSGMAGAVVQGSNKLVKSLSSLLLTVLPSDLEANTQPLTGFIWQWQHRLQLASHKGRTNPKEITMAICISTKIYRQYPR